jgi:hypothetical protein
MLGRSQLKATVVRDSASANVIVIAANGTKELPEHIAEWVENCISHDPENGTVLVALHEGHDGRKAGGDTGPLCASLEQIAHRHGATFMCSKDFEEHPEDDVAPDPAFETPRNPIRVAGSAPHPAAALHRWWGIND